MTFKTSQNCSAVFSSDTSELPGLLRQSGKLSSLPKTALISLKTEKYSPKCLFSSERGQNCQGKKVMKNMHAHLKLNTLTCSPTISHSYLLLKWQPLMPLEMKHSHLQCAAYCNPEGLKKKKKSNFMTIALLYNLRFCFFTPIRFL